ncbi:hypothetical protein M3Y96_00680800 [Aphelenchoides besseyi]|nr:hypothetical protein M3Y96_00680800 [Aphelenchoides besseyi]
MRASWLDTVILNSMLFMLVIAVGSKAFSIREDMIRGGKRTSDGTVKCPPYAPFQCPMSLECISFKYICDQSIDCLDSYDENEQLCTAAKRPPPLEIASFIDALIQAHGRDFGVKIFGARAKNGFKAMGGVDQVAVALSQSPTIETFAKEMSMSDAETEHMAKTLEAIISGDTSELSRNEAADFAFFARKLRETNFF